MNFKLHEKISVSVRYASCGVAAYPVIVYIDKHQSQPSLAVCYRITPFIIHKMIARASSAAVLSSDVPRGYQISRGRVGMIFIQQPC